MKASFFLALASFVAASAPAHADVHQRFLWVDGSGSQGFGIAHFDLDDATGVLSAWADYQNFASAVTGVTIGAADGGALIEMQHTGGTTGFAYGAAAIPAPAQLDFFAGGLTLEVRTLANPAGEILATLPPGGGFSALYALDAAQVGAESPAAGTGFAFLGTEGQASLSGQLSGLVGSVTGVEWRGPGYFGVDGPLILELDHQTTNGQTTLFGTLPVLAGEVLADFKDGLHYVLVRTDAFPEGEVRGQIASPLLGQPYCAGRPNSVAFNGARLWAEGSVLAADADLVLMGQFLPPGRPVLPIVGLATGHVFTLPNSSGMLCVSGGPILRLAANLGVSGPTGDFSTEPDLAALPLGGGTIGIEPGDVWNFQLWYRDQVGGLPTSNLSSALSIRFH